MKKKTIEIPGTKALNVPIARAVSFGQLLFISAIAPTDIKTGKLLLGRIEEETEQVLKNLQVTLKEGGSSLECVLKTTVYLADIKDFA